VWTAGGMLADPTSHQSKSKCYTPGVESRVGGCASPSFRPDNSDNTDDTTRTSGGHEAANRRQAAGGWRQAIGTHQGCVARWHIQRGQLAAGSWHAAGCEVGGGQPDAGWPS
jgi:hypothetical protein